MDEAQNWKPVEADGRREPICHREPGEEFLFYRSVAAGMIDAVQENCSRGAFENMEGAGRLSDNPVTNLKYHFVVTAAMLTRFCMEGGMAMEEAFSLSDEYIRRMDCCNNMAEIVYIHDQMALDFVCRMRALKKNAASSKQVADAIDYIDVHLMDRITINDLAAAICVSPAHRHKGMGGRLLEHAFSQAQRLGRTRIEIGIVEENQRLRRWYEGYGFTHIGTKKFDFFPFTCGYMEKRL